MSTCYYVKDFFTGCMIEVTEQEFNDAKRWTATEDLKRITVAANKTAEVIAKAQRDKA